MSITQPATTPTAPVTTETPAAPSTPANTDTYDANGHQVVEDGVLDFDAGELGDEEIIDETVTDTSTPQVPANDPSRAEQPTTPDPNKPNENQPTTTEQPQTELKMYADKYKTVQDLKNAFIELGGDPAKFGDNVQLLEEAYAVRQSEFSRSRAAIAAQQQQPQQPMKSYQEIMREEMAKYDPSKFQTPQEMWEAQAKAQEEAARRFEEQQQGNRQQQITPQEMDRQIKIVNNIHSIETKVPRLKTDQNFRNAFAMHIRVMRDQGRVPTLPDGTDNLDACMKDFISGQSAVVEEARKAYEGTQAAKELSTTTSTDPGAGVPGSGAPHRNSNDALVEDILGEYANHQRMYAR